MKNLKKADGKLLLLKVVGNSVYVDTRCNRISSHLDTRTELIPDLEKETCMVGFSIDRFCVMDVVVLIQE
jgi:hypothetical protein